jgi:hypothetical protein
MIDERFPVFLGDIRGVTGNLAKKGLAVARRKARRFIGQRPRSRDEVFRILRTPRSE